MDQTLRRCLSISHNVSRSPSGLTRPAYQPAGALRSATYYIIPILYLICQAPSFKPRRVRALGKEMSRKKAMAYDRSIVFWMLLLLDQDRSFGGGELIIFENLSTLKSNFSAKKIKLGGKGLAVPSSHQHFSSFPKHSSRI